LSPDTGHYFKRNSESRSTSSNQSSVRGGAGPAGGGLALNNDVISKILAATRAMPTWKACEIENTSWVGTGDENVKKYMALQGAVV
jgi:hypothetical protein